MAIERVMENKKAFTLAEVLVVLGIIGVVASVTVPNVVHKYRAWQLRVAFNKSYSNIQNAFTKMKADMGFEGLGNYFAYYDGKDYTHAGEFNREFPKYFRSIKTVDYKKGDLTATNYSNTVVHKPTDNGGYCRPFSYYQKMYILPDGSSFHTMVINNKAIITVDTNGPYKKPNRMGYDIFMFEVDKSNDRIVPMKMEKLYTKEELQGRSDSSHRGIPCSSKSSQSANGCGCAWYAVNDINPDDETKGYWESLK